MFFCFMVSLSCIVRGGLALEETKNVRVEARRDVMLYGTCKFSSRPFCTHFKVFLMILNSCGFPRTKPLLSIIDIRGT